MSELSDFNIVDSTVERPDADLAPIQVSKKRKRKQTEEVDPKEHEVLLAQARLQANDAKEWSKLQRMSDDRLRGYLSEKSFERAQRTHKSFFSCVTNMLGLVVDKVLKADGYVEETIAGDEELQNSLAEELCHLASFISNRSKIALFLTSDVVKGKQAQLKEQTTDADVSIVQVDEPVVSNQDSNVFSRNSGDQTGGDTVVEVQNQEEEEVLQGAIDR